MEDIKKNNDIIMSLSVYAPSITIECTSINVYLNNCLILLINLPALYEIFLIFEPRIRARTSFGSIRISLQMLNNVNDP